MVVIKQQLHMLHAGCNKTISRWHKLLINNRNYFMTDNVMLMCVWLYEMHLNSTLFI